jgi:hypothetical protein
MQDVHVKINQNCQLKSRIQEEENSLFKFHLNLRKKLAKCYIWSIASYGAETWTLRKVEQKYLESFEMWCWIGKEISCTDREKNEEVLQ